MDLKEVEKDFRLGTMTDTQLACKHGTSSARIGQLKKEYGWEKDPVPDREIIPDPIKEKYDPGDKTSDYLANYSIDLAERMLDELHQTTSYIGDFETYVKEAFGGDSDQKRFNALMKAISLSERANTLKTLSNILVQTRGVIIPKKSVGTGKKAEAESRAADVAKGNKFAPSAPPLKVVQK